MWGEGIEWPKKFFRSGNAESDSGIARTGENANLLKSTFRSTLVEGRTGEKASACEGGGAGARKRQQNYRKNEWVKRRVEEGEDEEREKYQVKAGNNPKAWNRAKERG